MDNTDLIKLCIWIFFTQFIYGYYLYSYTKFQTTSITLHCVKSIHLYSNFSGPYFPAFGLNSERYSVSLGTQSECLKIQTRKTPNTDTFHALLDFRLDPILPFSSKLEFYFTFFHLLVFTSSPLLSRNFSRWELCVSYKDWPSLQRSVWNIIIVSKVL